MRRTACVAALLALGTTAADRANAVAYEGTLANGSVVVGSIGGFSWEDEDAAQADFWLFGGNAGDTIRIAIARGDAGLDPAMSLYHGTSGADGSQFLNDADWGSIVYLGFADDETEHPGPGGDPLLASFVLPFSGDYTVAVGGIQSLTNGPYAYSLSFNAVPVPVPEPMSAALLLGGLTLLARIVRKHRGA